MMSNTNKTHKSALVLQGGGALGAFEHGVLKTFYAEGYQPDIICGISIGAFSAAALAGAKTQNPIDSLERMWNLFTAKDNPFLPPEIEQRTSTYFNKGMYYPNPIATFAPDYTTHRFINSPLYDTLDQVIDFDKLNSDSAPEVVIGATNVETGLIEYFSNKASKERPKTRLTPDHIVASGSFPSTFPMVDIDGQKYWDGGLFTSTPLRPAIEALKCCDDSLLRELIMIELYPSKGTIPTTLDEVSARMLQLNMDSNFVFDQKAVDKHNKLVELARKLDDTLPENSEIREDDEFKKMQSYKRIDNFIKIEYEPIKHANRLTDFTEQTLKKRIELGEAIGKRYVNTLLK